MFSFGHSNFVSIYRRSQCHKILRDAVKNKKRENVGMFPKSRSSAFWPNFTAFFCCHFVAVSIGLYSQKMEVGISVIVEKASIQCIPIISILVNFPESSWFISSRLSPVNLCLGGCITIHIALTPISNIAKWLDASHCINTNI